MRHTAFGFAIFASLIVAQPGLTAPVADAQAAVMARRLFPALEAIKPARLSDARGMLNDRRVRIQTCGQDAPCLLKAALWTDAERALVVKAAEKVLAAESGLQTDDGAAAQVTRELVGLNAILQVYGQGLPPRNPLIEGPVYPPGGVAFANRVATAISISRAGEGDVGEIDPSVALALALLDVNDRTEAVDFEPLEARYNAAAKARAATLDWTKYRYTAIILPGNGPDLDGEALTPRAKLRVRLVAGRFAEGVAPFIIVSGGAVHPRGTKVSEAVEMRKALIERYGVPEDRIILEPYARYTLTNLRNAVRRLKAIGAPLEREALVITDVDHINTMAAPQFSVRALAQLGYQPGRTGPRPSDTELVFLPSPASLRVDPLDPLDP